MSEYWITFLLGWGVFTLLAGWLGFFIGWLPALFFAAACTLGE
jgi:hypothetical protein